MSDSSKNQRAAEESGLRIVRDSSLTLLPNEGTPALEEMVSRALAQIRSNPTSGLIQSTGELAALLKAGDEREFEIAPGVKIVMCWIPPGEFLMGNADDEDDVDDSIQHKVKITQGFWLAKTQTTQAQWQAVMGNNPSLFKGRNLPVEQVKWNDVCGNDTRSGGFLGKLNQFSTVGGRFDLPTEAQWEYACRAGTSGEYAGDLDQMGWYGDNAGRETNPVGQKKPNAWGLHDMHGNVVEWCADWWGSYDLNVVEDPTGPATGWSRVSRGGGWQDYEDDCRSASRETSGSTLDYIFGVEGFRAALSFHPNQLNTKTDGARGSLAKFKSFALSKIQAYRNS
jgi:formylglycine-generating enzyme required for sulfatase activity